MLSYSPGGVLRLRRRGGGAVKNIEWMEVSCLEEMLSVALDQHPSPLHSQAIDEQVEREDSQSDTPDRLHVDTHAEVSPPTPMLFFFNNVFHTTDRL